MIQDAFVLQTIHSSSRATASQLSSGGSSSTYSANTQSLEQIMKKANDIIKKSRQSVCMNATASLSTRTDYTESESYGNALTTADSQKHSLSTNRDGQVKVSPFLPSSQSPPTSMVSPPSHQQQQQLQQKAPRHSPHINTTSCREDTFSENYLSSNAKPAVKMINEADIFFDSFDSHIKVTFVPSSTASNSRDPASTSTTSQAVRSLMNVFERVKKEEVQSQTTPLNLSKQHSFTNNPSQQQQQQGVALAPSSFQAITTTTSVSPYGRAHSQSIPTPSSSNSCTAASANEFLQYSRVSHRITPPQNVQDNQRKSLIPIHPSTATSTIGGTQSLQAQSALMKSVQQNSSHHHPPPLPLPQKPQLQGYNTNHFTNATRFRHRHSLRERDNSINSNTPTTQAGGINHGACPNGYMNMSGSGSGAHSGNMSGNNNYSSQLKSTSQSNSGLSGGFFHTPSEANQNYAMFLQCNNLQIPNNAARANQQMQSGGYHPEIMSQRSMNQQQMFQVAAASSQLMQSSQHAYNGVQRQRAESTFSHQSQSHGGDRLTTNDLEISQSSSSSSRQVGGVVNMPVRQRASVHVPSAEGRFARPYPSIHKMQLSSSSSRVSQPAQQQGYTTGSIVQHTGPARVSLPTHMLSSLLNGSGSGKRSGNGMESINSSSLNNNHSTGSTRINAAAQRGQTPYVMPKK